MSPPGPASTAGPTTSSSQEPHGPESAARSAEVNSGSYSAPEASYLSFAARPAAAAREPLAVRAGRDPIPATVHEEDRRGHLRGVESPRGDVGKVVVYQPDRSSLHGRTDDLVQPGHRLIQPLARRGEEALADAFD